MTTISVIVPYKDEERFIEHCIISLRSQSLPRERYEIIMIDNASKDRSPDIVKKYPDIISLREYRKGPYVCRNAGIAQAKGDIIAFTDADCVVAHDWLEKINAAITSGTDIVLGSRTFPNHASLALQSIADYENERMTYVYQLGIRHYCYAYTNNMGCRASLFNEYGHFDLVYGTAGDTAFLHKVMTALPSVCIKYDETITVCHEEMDSLMVWLKKCRDYGYYNSFVAAVYSYHALTFKQKLSILDRTIKKQRSIIARSLLILVLMLGDAAYHQGLLYRWLFCLRRNISEKQALCHER
jgi:glycosyltransferase involved in cell wall biosynthesis